MSALFPALRLPAGLGMGVPRIRPLARSALRARALHASSATPAERQVLGRITPKRIAIPIDPGATAGEGMPRSSIWRPIVFAVGASGLALGAAALYTNEDARKWSNRLGAGSVWRMGREPSDRDLQRARQLDAAKRAQGVLNDLPRALGFLPNFLLVPIVRTYVLVSEYRINTPASATAPLTLIGIMGGVFLAWRVRAWEPFMRRWFLHRPVILGNTPRREWTNCVTMLTSTSLGHFAFNSIALYSFGSAAYSFLAAPDPNIPPLPTSTYTPHFFAFFVAAGLFASLGSHLFTNIALAAHQAILPSLGASGAIYGALTMTALAYPDSHVSIIFLPFISIPISLGVGGMVALDLIGIIRGWRTFDHVAHFAGAMFGVLYYSYGKPFWYAVRRTLGADDRQSTMY